jgi:hypothetical protein
MKIINEKTHKEDSATIYVWKAVWQREPRWDHDHQRIFVDEDNIYYAGHTTVDIEKRLASPYSVKGYGKRDDVQLVALHEATESEDSYALENKAIYTLTVFEKIMRSKGRKCECLNININQCSVEWREINMTLLKHLCKEHDIDFKDECRKLKQEKIEETQQDIKLLQDEMRNRIKANQDKIQELKTKINKLKKVSLDKVWST